MYRINIILMLSTIIPSLDCCSSRSLFQRQPINVYRAVDFSLHKTPSPSENNAPPAYDVTMPTQPQVTTGDDQTTLSYRLHHLHYDKKDEEHFKLNHSQRSDGQQKEEEEVRNEFKPGIIDSQADIASTTTTTTPMDIPKEDAHYKLMSEIISIECVELFRFEFCLNGGRCFLYPILNQSLSSCECADGYVGERCEAKSFEFIPRIHPRVVLAKTIVGPLVFGLAIIDILFLLFLFCKKCYRD